MRRLAAILLLVLAASTACAETPRKYESAQGVAAELGCTAFKSDGGAKLVKDTGSCSIDGDRVAIYLFENTEQRDRWMPLGRRLAEDLIVGPNWAVDPPDGSRSDIAELLNAE